MRRRLATLLAIAVTMTTMVAVSAGAAFAVAEPGDRFNPGNEHAYESGNCIAFGSSFYTHNGLASGGTLGEGNNYPGQTGPSGGARGEEIKYYQGLCAGNDG